MRVTITESAFDPLQEVAVYQKSLPAGKFGATAVFVGTMRDFNDGNTVTSMTLEHYPEMTERHLTQLAEQVRHSCNVTHLLIKHRVGEIHPGESIVLVAVWSEHRAAAFEACEMMVENLKSQAPFWKKENLVAGQSRWVEHNTEGRQSTA